MSTPATPAPTQLPRPKRGRWWKIVLGVVIILLALVALAPTVLSTSAGKDFLLGQVNARSPVKLSADSMSLGWFTGATVHKLGVADAQGKGLLAIDQLATGVSVWDALAGSTIDLSKFSATGATLPERPGVVVAVKLAGNADLGKKLLHFTGDSEITATDGKSGSISKLAIPAGSVASWGDVANDIHAVLTYHLPDIQPLIADKLPKDSVLDGSYTMPIHIVGALSKDQGLRAIRGFTIDETKVGEGRIYMEGFDVGTAEIPYHMEKGILTIVPTDLPFKDGGRIRVRGRIDFNANPPAFIIDTPDDPAQPFIKDLALNHQIAAGKLRFFPLLWGAGANSNIGQIGGKVDLRLNAVNIPLDAEAFKTKATLSGTLEIHDLTTDAPFLSDALKQLGPIAKITQPDILNIRGGNIPDVPFSLANGKVSYQNLRLGTDKVNISFSGSVGLDDSLAMTMQVSARGVAIPIPIALKGTTAKPEITLRAGAARETPDKTIQKAVPGLIDQFMKKQK